MMRCSLLVEKKTWLVYSQNSTEWKKIGTINFTPLIKLLAFLTFLNEDLKLLTLFLAEFLMHMQVNDIC